MSAGASRIAQTHGGVVIAFRLWAKFSSGERLDAIDSDT
jgi:hypothetical protein